MIRYVPVQDAATMSHTAADALATVLASDHPVVALPTGRTPQGVYAELVRRHRSGAVDFSRAVTFNLDEYVGLPPEHPASFRAFMETNLFQHVNLLPENIHFLCGTAPDLEQECRAYESAITRAGGIALGVLGVGSNGHIAFNEPGTPWGSRSHVTNLAEETRQANAGFFGSPDLVPRQAITMGIETILEMARILLLVSGANKAGALAALYRGEPDPRWPVTALLSHPDVTVLIDTATVPLPAGLDRKVAVGEGDRA